MKATRVAMLALVACGVLIVGCAENPAGGFSSDEDAESGIGNGFEWSDTGVVTGLPLGGSDGITANLDGDAGSVPPPDGEISPSDTQQGEGGESVEPADTYQGGGTDSTSTSSNGDLQISIQLQDSILSGISPVIATVTGGEWILGVEFHIDGLKVDTDVVPPYTLALDTQAYEDGPHEIAVYTADSLGGYASATTEILFDNSPPEILSVSPGNESTVFYEDGPFSVNVEVDEPEKVTYLTIRANGLLIGEFTEPPFATTVNYEDLFIGEEDLPKTVFLQISAKDVLEQVTDLSLTAQIHSRLRWVFQTLFEIKGRSAVLSNGLIVFGNNGGEIYAMNSDGTVNWQHTVDGQIFEGILNDPATGNFYFGVLGGSEAGGIYAMNQGGGVVWSAGAEAPVGGRPSMDNNNVYVGLFSGKIQAVDKSTGSEVWSHSVPSQVTAGTKTNGSGRVYIGGQDAKFYAFDPGGLAWSVNVGGEIFSTPALDSTGAIYFGANDGWVYGVNESDGSHIWTTEVEGNLEGEPLIVEEEGVMYVASSTQYLTKLDLYTGEILWTKKLDYIAESAPVRGADGTIYVGSQTYQLGRIFALNPENGDILFDYPVGAVVIDALVISGDQLYFGATDRNFYSLWTTDANLFVPEEVSQE